MKSCTKRDVGMIGKTIIRLARGTHVGRQLEITDKSMSDKNRNTTTMTKEEKGKGVVVAAVAVVVAAVVVVHELWPGESTRTSRASFTAPASLLNKTFLKTHP
jgi:p-aminobenzoyl-glutamate transporter AbgT